MNKAQVKEIIERVGLIPVVRAHSREHACLAAEAVSTGGIPIIEITMTVPGALEVIRHLAQTMPHILVGAGTVLNPTQAQACLEAGAKFLVSPGLDLHTVRFAAANETVMAAGALTPTEIMAASDAGADYVKIFPCAQLGGAKYLKALRGPFPDIPFVPTGGVNLETAAALLLAGAAALGVGGELVSADALNAGTPEIITEAARQFVSIVQQTRQTQKQKGSAN